MASLSTKDERNAMETGKSLKLLPPDVVILKLKWTKFDFGYGFASGPVQRSLHLLAEFKGACF